MVESKRLLEEANQELLEFNYRLSHDLIGPIKTIRGLGLKNIQNRIILLKGSIYFTGGDEGYRINIHVPVKSNQ